MCSRGVCKGLYAVGSLGTVPSESCEFEIKIVCCAQQILTQKDGDSYRVEYYM